MTALTFDDLLATEVPPTGHVGPTREATIREAFLRFHRENPHVYTELVALCQQARARGVTRMGMGMCFEVLRWHRVLRTGGDDFRLNNNYRAYYSRLIMRLNPEYEGLFEIRAQQGRGLGEDDL